MKKNLLIMFALCLSITACWEDGEPGPQGEQGEMG